MSLELWLAKMDRDLSQEEQAYMMELLPPQRRERLERQQSKNKREVLCAYLILRMALQERLGWRDLPAIAIGDQGKPFFPDHPEVHFSLSHTTAAAAAAVSDLPVGVDIEHIRPVSVRTMERLAGVQTTEAFFKSWVRREARAKRTGAGVVTMVRGEAPLNRGEFYYEAQAFPGYVAGVATQHPHPPETVRRLVLDEVL